MDARSPFLAVLFVLGLCIALVYFLNGRRPLSPKFLQPRGRIMQVVDRLPLGPQSTMYLVRAADRGLLVAMHGNSCTVLETRPWNEWEEQLRCET